MSAAWLIVAVVLAVGVVLLAVSWFRRHDNFDLGTVSHQWIAEQRFGPGQDSRR